MEIEHIKNENDTVKKSGLIASKLKLFGSLMDESEYSLLFKMDSEYYIYLKEQDRILKGSDKEPAYDSGKYYHLPVETGDMLVFIINETVYVLSELIKNASGHDMLYICKYEKTKYAGNEFSIFICTIKDNIDIKMIVILDKNNRGIILEFNTKVCIDNQEYTLDIVDVPILAIFDKIYILIYMNLPGAVQDTEIDFIDVIGVNCDLKKFKIEIELKEGLGKDSQILDQNLDKILKVTEFNF